MEDQKKNGAPGLDTTEAMKQKYGKVYEVGISVPVDDENDQELNYRFKRPPRSRLRPLRQDHVEGRHLQGEQSLHSGLGRRRRPGAAHRRYGGIPRHFHHDREQARRAAGPRQRRKFEEALKEKVAGIRESVTESALLEIYRYVPPPLLEHFDPETIDDFDVLLDYLAKARFIQQLEQDIVARAISEVFSPD